MSRLISCGVAALLFTAWLPVAVHAMTPVIDAAAIAKLVEQYNQLKKEYGLLQDTYQNAKDQLEKAKQIVKDAEGHYGFGILQNSVADLKNRMWSPEDWASALKGLAGGNPQRYNQLLDEYKQNHSTLSSTDYQKGASEAKAADYQQQVTVNQAVTVQATYAFNDIKQHLQTVHDLSANVEQADNTKAAVDLNSRLLTELAYVAIQQLKMQALLNQQLSQGGASAIAGETQNAKFNALPE